MSKFKDEFNRIKKENGTGPTIAALILMVPYIFLQLAVSWGIVCLFGYAIFYCFNLSFTFYTGTGIWLILIFGYILVSSLVKYVLLQND